MGIMTSPVTQAGQTTLTTLWRYTDGATTRTTCEAATARQWLEPDEG
jgi:hypothetical protein